MENVEKGEKRLTIQIVVAEKETRLNRAEHIKYATMTDLND